MNYLKSILLIAALVLHFSSQAQDNVIKKGFVNFATLIVDYETYEFEGGNLAYYDCTDCGNQSIPFLIDYQSPGDFGGITFHLEPTMDVLFDATIIWAGQGQISYPATYDLTAPFNYIETPIAEPSDIQYINTDGEEMDDSYLLSQAQLVWDAVDSLRITNLLAENNYKAVVYFYPPTVGAVNPKVAKWIVFLYYSDKTSSIDFPESEIKHFNFYPNPAENIIRVKQQNSQVDLANFKIYDSEGKIVKEGNFNGAQNDIEVSDLSSGLYFVELVDNHGNFVAREKFIKK